MITKLERTQSKGHLQQMSIQMSVFHHKTGFSQTSQLLFNMFQCIEHAETNKFLYSLACTWMTIIDSQFYILTVYL